MQHRMLHLFVIAALVLLAPAVVLAHARVMARFHF